MSQSPFTSPRKGTSGRAGVRSPWKKRTIDILDIGTVLLRSPVKRSMNELNRLALKRAMEHKEKAIDDDDAIEEQELALADKIIEQSKLEPALQTVSFEIDETEDKQGRKTDRTIKNEEYKEEPYSPSTSFKDEDEPYSPSKSYSKSERRSNVSPLKGRSSPSPFKVSRFDYYEDKLKPKALTQRLLSLTETDKHVSSALESVETTPINSPRKSYKRNASMAFNDMEDVRPLNVKDVKLMDIPEPDEENDVLLQTDKTVKNQSMYHDGFDGYFEQNRLRAKPSSNTMAMAPTIDYDEFHKFNKILDSISSKPVDYLNRYYEQQAPQWLFEIQQGFNLALYGVGSKRDLVNEFVVDVLLPRTINAKCLVVNGYNTEFNPKVLLRAIWQQCFKRLSPTTRDMVDLCNTTVHEFSKSKWRNRDLVIVIHNIDGEPLRNEKYQYILSELAKVEQITMLCSVDNVNTPIFWDSSVMAHFNFIWHNVSTFKSYQTEISFRDPLSLGKSNEFVGSKGAKYVLSSLTSNAKSLYKHLVLQQLEKIDMSIAEDPQLMDFRGTIKGTIKTCTTYREFYEFCVSEFITSNEISFRTILGEFVEHKMCHLTRDTSGTDIIFISFTVDEMERLLEEEFVD